MVTSYSSGATGRRTAGLTTPHVPTVMRTKGSLYKGAVPFTIPALISYYSLEILMHHELTSATWLRMRESARVLRMGSINISGQEEPVDTRLFHQPIDIYQ